MKNNNFCQEFIVSWWGVHYTFHVARYRHISVITILFLLFSDVGFAASMEGQMTTVQQRLIQHTGKNILNSMRAFPKDDEELLIFNSELDALSVLLNDISAPIKSKIIFLDDQMIRRNQNNYPEETAVLKERIQTSTELSELQARMGEKIKKMKIDLNPPKQKFFLFNARKKMIKNHTNQHRVYKIRLDLINKLESLKSISSDVELRNEIKKLKNNLVRYKVALQRNDKNGYILEHTFLIPLEHQKSW